MISRFMSNQSQDRLLNVPTEWNFGNLSHALTQQLQLESITKHDETKLCLYLSAVAWLFHVE